MMTEYYLEAPGAAMLAVEREWIKAASAEVAARFDAPVIVHLGAGMGASMHCSRAGAPGAWIVGVDLEPGKFRWWPEEPEWDTCQMEVIEADTRLFHLVFEGEVHFLFIDADHSKGSVLADMIGWLPKVAAGGLVAFHDYGNQQFRWCIGVSQAVDAWDWTGWEEVPAAGSIKAFRRKGNLGSDDDIDE